jgi:hypothetical protein
MTERPLRVPNALAFLEGKGFGPEADFLRNLTQAGDDGRSGDGTLPTTTEVGIHVFAGTRVEEHHYHLSDLKDWHGDGKTTTVVTTDGTKFVYPFGSVFIWPDEAGDDVRRS